jgi:hypothetical protein
MPVGVVFLEESVEHFIVLDKAQFSPAQRLNVRHVFAEALDFLEEFAVFLLQLLDFFQVSLSFTLHPIEVDKSALSETEPCNDQTEEEKRKQ